MARRRRKLKLRGPLVGMLLAGAVISGYYTVFFKPIHDAGPLAEAPAGADSKLGRLPPPRPSALLAAETPGSDSTHTEAASQPSSTQPAPGGESAAVALVTTGLESLGRGELLDARTRLSEALARGLPVDKASEARLHLSHIADQTIFGPAIAPDDPHVSAYVVQAGDTLAKIAKSHHLTSDLLSRINGLADKNRIREGQRLKVIRGPFRVMVDRSRFEMDVYLGDTVIKQFRVGLGTDGKTPSGSWKVYNKLMNPTYYPPRGGPIIAADDPKNPLGERWIGLTGTEGEAVGQERYGIHGTIEPESIGKNMSLGCVRMLNADVELLFELLVEERSTVIIR